MSSIISITQIIETSTNVTLSAVSGKIQRVVNTGASSITVTYGSSTFSLPAGKFADFWYENSTWRVSDSNLISASAPTFTGLLDISSSGAGQIKFPATQNPSSDANTLDDYEEGTFTPALYSSGGGSATYVRTPYGKYTKMGNIVFFTVEIYWSDHTGSGYIYIVNLPFTTLMGETVLNILGSGLTYSGQLTAKTMISGITFIQPMEISSGGVQTELPLDAAGYLQISGFYFIS